MRSRPTILGLMGVIACLAVAMAAMRTNDEIWSAVTLTLTVAILCTAALIALYRRGGWAGFAIFGWAQFLICQPPSAPPLGPTSLSIGLACRFLPYIQAGAHPPDPSFRIPGYPAISSVDGEPMLMGVKSNGSATGTGFIPVHSLRAGLCLSSLIAGYFGALVGVYIARHATARRE